ncbi:MAG: hypothetical protein ACKOHI_10105, partial [Phycisphaerales bacterium]
MDGGDLGGLRAGRRGGGLGVDDRCGGGDGLALGGRGLALGGRGLALGGALVLTAATGSGKTTQVPQIVLESGLSDGQVVVLEPRRLAARMTARRVAQEMGCT